MTSPPDIEPDAECGGDEAPVEGEAGRAQPLTRIEQPAALREVEGAPTDEPRRRRDHSEGVQRLDVESASPGLAPGHHAADQYPESDGDPVPGHGDGPELDRRVDADGDHGLRQPSDGKRSA